MTPAQESALQQVRQIVNEHFEAWTLCVRSTDENQHDQINTFWGGPIDSVIGLARVTTVRLDRRIIETSGDAEEFPKA